KLATITTTNVEDATEYVATLKSLRSTTIQPQIEGQITQIFVTSGDRVAAGTPLIQIDPRRQQAAVSSQEAERAAREAAVNFARQQQARSSELYAAGAISKQELEQAETALRTAIDAVRARAHHLEDGSRDPDPGRLGAANQRAVLRVRRRGRRWQARGQTARDQSWIDRRRRVHRAGRLEAARAAGRLGRAEA